MGGEQESWPNCNGLASEREHPPLSPHSPTHRPQAAWNKLAASVVGRLDDKKLVTLTTAIEELLSASELAKVKTGLKALLTTDK